MPQRRSAGLLMVRQRPAGPEVLLAHPGGPYWARRDLGAWTLPKGEHGEDETPLTAARREFTEETGFESHGPFHPLGEVRLKSGKQVAGWSFLGDADPADLRSNSFSVEWPPRSGRLQSFPEVDRVAWFDLAEARRRILPAQAPFLDRVEEWLEGPRRDADGTGG